MNRTLCLVCGLVGLHALVHGADKPPEIPFLAGRQVLQTGIDLAGGKRSRDFGFVVGRQTYGVGVSLRNAPVDLDVVVLGPRQDEILRLESGDFNEHFFLHRMGERSLVDGTYTLRVGYFLDEEPSAGGRVLDRIGFDIEFEEVQAVAGKSLQMGELHQDVLEPAKGMMSCFSLRLQPGQKTLRVDVLDSQADLDFFVFAGDLAGDPFLAPWRARSYRTREYLSLDLEAVRSRTPGWNGQSLEVMVLCRLDEVPTGFTILPSASQGVPLVLAGLPSPADLQGGVGKRTGRTSGATVLERALAATVEVLGQSGGGTGCVVSPDGLVITNLHVISGLDGLVEQELAIGFPVDWSKAPDSQFLARVVDTDREKDLALLQICKGFYGQDLPAGYRFPWLPLGDSRNLRMGDELLFSGYPLLGGLGSRSTLTLTRGIVSGYEDRGYGVLIKTDALIAPGNSGGAALDREGRMVGIPTLVVSDTASRMAWIHPAEIFPPRWLRLVDEATR